MVNSAVMPHASAPVAVVDALNSLLEAEQNNIIRFMDEGSPYLSRATIEVKRPIESMVRSSFRHCGEIFSTIERLGGNPRPRGLQPEEQYLAFLSLKFLLPKLVDAKKLTIRRYENTLRAVEDGPGEVIALLRRHLAEHQSELAMLEKAAADVLAGK
jgi:hypothetical protein